MRNFHSTRHGLFFSIKYLCLNAGYALSIWVGYTFYILHEISWRGPYNIRACLAITLVIWTFFLPETPRWLNKNEFQCQDMLTLADLHAKGDIYDPLVTNSYAAILAAIRLKSHIGEATWGQLLRAHTPRCHRHHLSVFRPFQRDQCDFVFPPRKNYTGGVHRFALAPVRWRLCFGLLC